MWYLQDILTLYGMWFRFYFCETFGGCKSGVNVRYPGDGKNFVWGPDEGFSLGRGLRSRQRSGGTRRARRAEARAALTQRRDGGALKRLRPLRRTNLSWPPTARLRKRLGERRLRRVSFASSPARAARSERPGGGRRPGSLSCGRGRRLPGFWPPSAASLAQETEKRSLVEFRAAVLSPVPFDMIAEAGDAPAPRSVANADADFRPGLAPRATATVARLRGLAGGEGGCKSIFVKSCFVPEKASRRQASTAAWFSFAACIPVIARRVESARHRSEGKDVLTACSSAGPPVSCAG